MNECGEDATDAMDAMDGVSWDGVVRARGEVVRETTMRETTE